MASGRYWGERVREAGRARYSSPVNSASRWCSGCTMANPFQEPMIWIILVRCAPLGGHAPEDFAGVTFTRFITVNHLPEFPGM